MIPNYEIFIQHMRKFADVNYASALMQWDQEVYMPEAGAEIRAQQLATLSGIAHELGIATELGDFLKGLLTDDTLDDKSRRNVKEAFRNYSDRKKYTTEFVMEMSRMVSESFNAWQQAKKENNFSLFGPKLEKLVDLKLKECELLGYTDHPYDALLNQYEPGATTAQVVKLFDEARKQLVPFVKKVVSLPHEDDAFTKVIFDKQKQWDFGIFLLEQMGFDFKAGRQDISTHPFTINFSSNDVRVTTRINENDLKEMIWSCIHEGGHALYEQGLPVGDYGLPSGEYLSLAIHESQSRMWENNIGRSLEYWEFNYPKLQAIFPSQLANITTEQFYHAINKVQPSLIRTNADELTYHFHVMIRFEIEKGLMEKSLKVKDLPEIWNARYKEYLDIDVPDNAHGVLQDVHWSHGSFGYFPTYSMGSFYAAQFYNQMQKEIPDLKTRIKSGDMKPALNWLRKNIHIHGRLYTASELCKKITGGELDFNYFMNYATEKFGK